MEDRSTLRTLFSKAVLTGLVGPACLALCASASAQTLEGPSGDLAKAAAKANAEGTVSTAMPAPTIPEPAAAEAGAAMPLDPAAMHKDGVAARVNDEVISDYDLNERVKLFIATTGIKPTEAELKDIRKQVLTQLQDEKIQIQEAQRKKITVAIPEVNRRIQMILKDNNDLTEDELKATLAKSGVSESALRSQIATQLAWQKVVAGEYQDRIRITPEQIDAEMERIAESANKPHYAVSEIFFAVDTPEDNEKARQRALDVEKQIKQGGNFAEIARQVSQNPTAASGGDIGWISETQVEPELAQVLSTMQKGDISDPVRGRGGWYILGLRDRQEPANTKLPDYAALAAAPLPDTLPLRRVLLPLGPKPKDDVKSNAIAFANQMREHMPSCDNVQKFVEDLKVGAVYMDLGEYRIADASEAMRDALSKSQPGTPAPPFVSDAGVELMVRCDPKIEVRTAFHMPTRDQVESQLWDEQFTAWTRRYMRDLKRNADVQVGNADVAAR